MRQTAKAKANLTDSHLYIFICLLLQNTVVATHHITLFYYTFQNCLTNKRNCLWISDATRKQVKIVFFPINNHSMASIIPTLQQKKTPED